MLLIKEDTQSIIEQQDVVVVRKKVRTFALEIGFNLVDQTKVITAASELARNVLDYAGGGKLKLAIEKNELDKSGIQLVFEDQGPDVSRWRLSLRGLARRFARIHPARCRCPRGVGYSASHERISVTHRGGQAGA